MLKFKTYVKLIGILLLVLFIIYFMLSNTAPVEIRLLGKKEPVLKLPTYQYTFFVANAGILIFLIARGIRKLIKDINQLRREERTRVKLVSEIKSKVEQEQNVKPHSAGKETSNEAN
jgi:uncharacterized integral membrane protein